MSSKYILIADSGSTKTDWAYIHTETGNYQTVQSAGINPFYQTTEEIIPVLQSEVVPGIGGDIEEIHFYGAGCANEESSLPVTNALKHCFRSAKVVEVASDMLGAARGLCGHEPGLACILGTGTNHLNPTGTSHSRRPSDAETRSMMEDDTSVLPTAASARQSGRCV